EVAGSINSTVGYVAVQIPVGPQTAGVRLVLRSLMGIARGETPALGKILLMDSTGETLAEIHPRAAQANGYPPDRTIAMENAPTGGQLVVKVTSAPPALGMAGALPESTSPSNVPFLLDVQRQDQPVADESSQTITGSNWFGTVAVPSSISAGPLSQS